MESERKDRSAESGTSFKPYGREEDAADRHHRESYCQNLLVSRQLHFPLVFFLFFLLLLARSLAGNVEED